MRGRRELWSQKIRCLKQFGSQLWFKKLLAHNNCKEYNPLARPTAQCHSWTCCRMQLWFKCLLQTSSTTGIGSPVAFAHRPRLEKCVASIHIRTTSFPSPTTSIRRLIFWLSYRMPRLRQSCMLHAKSRARCALSIITCAHLSASSSLMYSPIYSQMKLPLGTKSGDRTPHPLANFPSVCMHRITSRRNVGPRCTRRLRQSRPQPLAREHS